MFFPAKKKPPSKTVLLLSARTTTVRHRETYYKKTPRILKMCMPGFFGCLIFRLIFHSIAVDVIFLKTLVFRNQ